MAIIVDKEQKKRDIALACRSLFVDEDINKITISQIAVTAGVGKGTIYEYFDNKDDILFALVDILMHEHNAMKEKQISKVDTLKEKIKIFYSFYYSSESSDLRRLYKDFIAISLISPNQKIIDFQTECVTYYYNWVEILVAEGIKKGLIKEESRMLIKGMFAFGQGMYIYSLSTHMVTDLEEEINKHVDTLFNLIKKETDA
jgi:AcrR family transcriptional regulator